MNTPIRSRAPSGATGSSDVLRHGSTRAVVKRPILHLPDKGCGIARAEADRPVKSLIAR